MYLAVDIGGTKILLASFTDEGEIKEHFRLPTPENYTDFLGEMSKYIDKFTTKDFRAAAVGVAGQIDRERGRRFASGRLAWDNVPILADIEKIANCPSLVENDAKLAGLSESIALGVSNKRILYVTVSTGIGYALVVNNEIDRNLGDNGGNTIMISQGGTLQSWESLAAGSAIVERYGKMAKDIHDDETWTKIATDLSMGLIELIAITEPDIIVFGGSVGEYFERYAKTLNEQLEKYQTPLTPLPELRKAVRPDEAVIYGCYYLAKQTYGSRINQPA